MLGRRLINTGAVACTTDTVQILNAGSTQSLALYRFEDNVNDTAYSVGSIVSSNRVIDLDANGHSGTDWTDSVSGINGQINGATYVNDGDSDYFDFDGNNDYINISATGTLDTGNVKSFEFWFQAGDEQHAGHILARSNTSFNQRAYAFRHNNDNFQAYFYNGSSSKFNGTFSVTRGGGWTHAVVTIAGTTSGSAVKMYKNGVEVVSGTLSGDVGTDSNFLTGIGRRNYSSGYDYFNGKIAQIRAYSVVLSEDEVLQNYNATRALYAAYHGAESNITYTTGKFGKGAVFNGSSSAIVLPNNILSSDCSISTWFNLDSNTGLHTLFEFDYENRILFRTSSTDTNLAYIGNSGYFNHGLSFSTGQWYHLVITFSAGNPFKIYVDGVLSYTGGNTSVSAFNNDNILGAANRSSKNI